MKEFRSIAAGEDIQSQSLFASDRAEYVIANSERFCLAAKLAQSAEAADNIALQNVVKLRYFRLICLIDPGDEKKQHLNPSTKVLELVIEGDFVEIVNSDVE